MNPTRTILPDEPGSQPPAAEAWLDRFEQILLRTDPQSATGLDTDAARRCLELLAAHAAGRGDRGAGALAGRLLGLVDAVARQAARPTSAVLDTMQRSVDALRAAGADRESSDVADEIAAVLVEIQALSGGLATTSLRAEIPSMPEITGSGPARDTAERAAAATEAGADALPSFWADVDTLLASLGPLADAQAELGLALHADQAPLPAGLTRALAQVDTRLRATTASAEALRATYSAHLPSAPQWQEIVCVRAGARHVLVPADCVVGCEPLPPAQPEAAASPPAAAASIAPGFDLAAWLDAAPAAPAGLPQGTRLALTVQTSGPCSTWIVDEVKFQRTVVLHRLETHFRSQPGVAGAAVLGGLGVCLVLDPARLGNAAPDGQAPARAPTSPPE